MAGEEVGAQGMGNPGQWFIRVGREPQGGLRGGLGDGRPGEVGGPSSASQASYTELCFK